MSHCRALIIDGGDKSLILMKKRLFLMLSVMMAWGVVCAQDWTEADSLRLDQLLKTDGEIKLNPRALEELRENG
ncbi:MAG: DUF4858 domain-containing protein, partial [Bacteroidales bacterium]